MQVVEGIIATTGAIIVKFLHLLSYYSSTIEILVSSRNELSFTYI